MRKSGILAISLLAVLALLIGVGAVACGGGVETPQPGEWIASTGSSQFTFTFTVSPDSTGIAEVSFNFAEFECGGVQVSGGVSVIPLTLWSITGSQFTVDTYIGSSGWNIVIQGMFDETGTHASGNWRISSQVETCQSGTWESSY